jgi:diguanylate cyclase (GGDEF)-like protein/PAS domain S-box-containing protein
VKNGILRRLRLTARGCETPAVDWIRRDADWQPLRLALPVCVGVGAIVLLLRELRTRSLSHEPSALGEPFIDLMEFAPDALLILDRDGVITRVNQQTVRMFGYDADELVGKPSDPIMGDTVRSENWQRRDQTGIEREIVTKDGRNLFVEIRLSPLRSGQPTFTVAAIRDISERKDLEARLLSMAERDPLTGLYNRRRFEGELYQELARAQRSGRGGALLAIDLDHFKFVNDTLGHSVGDELIVDVAELLRTRLRSTDVLGRLGGDEFAAILPQVDAEEAELVAANLVEAVRGGVQVDRYKRRITASIGVAPFIADVTTTPDDLMVQADFAMYDAKEAGRDRASTYTPESARQTRITDGVSWEERIREALDQDRFTLHAQPIVSLRDDQVPRHELLIRMRGDNGDFVAPGNFLYAAERSELIQEIDRWVLGEVVGILATHQRNGADVHLQVNVSALSLSDLDLGQIVDDQLRLHGVDGSGLCIEITETAALDNLGRAHRIAHDLNELGVELALDDFGAGTGSFYYLKHLAFDFLKIGGEFVESLPVSPSDQLIVRSMVEFARAQGKHTIAEFVGDAQTVALLRGYGVDYAQGFYLAEPGPLDRVDVAALTAISG